MRNPVPLYLVTIARRIKALLSRNQQRAAVVTMGLSFVANLAELAGLATVVSYALMIADKGFFEENPYVRALYQGLPVDSKPAFLLVTLAGILVLFLAKNALALAIEYRQARFAYRVANDFSRRQVRYFLSCDWLYHLRRSSHTILHEAKTIPFMFGTNLLLRGIGIIGDGLLAMLILAVVMAIDLPIAVAIAVILTPLVILGYQAIQKNIHRLGAERNILQPYAGRAVFQVSQAFPLIKLYNQEGFFLDTFVEYQRKLNRIQTWITTYSAFTRKFMEVVALLGILIIAGYAMLMGYSGQQLFLLISVYATASYKLIPSLSRVFDGIVAIRSTEYTLDNLEANLGGNQEQQHALSSVPDPLPFRQSINLEAVTYRYPEHARPTLDQLNLTISKGQAIGITGASGEGKSTLLYLLMQLLTPEEGAIKVDGTVLKPHHQKAWQQQLGLVWHHNFILDGTLQENVAFSEKQPNVNQHQLHQALEQAGLADLTAKLPQGIQTHLAEEGRALSEGQRQRIALARALYRDAEVLLLDEATNALDSNTENHVLGTLKALKDRGKTLVMVSHQINSLRICNQVYNLRNGRLEALYKNEHPQDMPGNGSISSNVNFS